MPNLMLAGAEAPAVSIVMPVHNALPYLDAAVESILNQTFSDFEFVILDDASTDGSTERLRDWAKRDPRIRLFETKRSLGPVGSSNRVARAASAPIVARMDADDISYPDRLADQLNVLRRNPDVGLVASLCDFIDAGGRRFRTAETWRLARNSFFVPFAHGAIMYRREVFDAAGGYRDACEYWEDQDLITRISSISRILVTPRSLYQVRQSTTSTRFTSNPERLERAVNLMYRCVQRVEQGRDYDDLLASREIFDEKLDPRVFIALGSVVLWAGNRPRLFRRLLRRGKLSFDLRSLSALVWTAWASAEPHSLRLFLRLLLHARQAVAPVTPAEGEQVPWSPSASHRPYHAGPDRHS